MTVWEVLAALLLWTVLLAAAGVAWRWSHRRVTFKRQVLVNTTDGNALSGAMLRTTAHTLVLGNASAVSEDGGSVSLDGTVHIERARVLFVQEL